MEELWHQLSRHPNLGERKRILLYPTNRYLLNFVSIVKNSKCPGPKIVSFIDDNLEGELSLMGYSVKPPEQFSALDFDAVVIGSHKFSNDLRKNCQYVFGPHCKIIDLLEFQKSMESLFESDLQLSKAN